jgi:hypothetical protein
MQKNTPHLSERNLKTIYTIGRFKFLTSHKVWKEFYPTTSYENASQRLTKMHKDGFLSREFAYPKAVTNPGRHPTAIYFFTAQNKANLRVFLTSHGKADVYEDFAVLPTIDKDDANSYSNSHLVHECNNAEFFISLEKGVAAHPAWELLMWEITNPRSAEIPDKDIKGLKVRDRRTRNADGTPKEILTDRHFNPDGLALLREPSGDVTLNVVETDNNSNNPSDMRAKYEAFIGYGNRDRFPKLIEFYARKYHLDIPNPEDILVRYLFIASNQQSDHKRRNQLFLWSLPYGRQKQLLFTSLTDCTPEHILTGNIWMRGREYRDHAHAHMERIIHPDTAPTLRLRKQHEILNNPEYMPLVSLGAD